MHHANECLNCAHHLEMKDNFCAQCGQSAHTHQRITMHHIGHEVIHAVAHADKGFFHLIKALTIQPGITIKEYLSGKHKKYFSPFSFFFIVLGFFVLSNTFFKPFDSAAHGNTETASKNYPKVYKTAKQREKYDKIQGRVATAMHFINTKTNIMLCISTPLMAYVLFLLFRRKLFYAENLVIMTFINGYLNLWSIAVFTPLLYFTKGTPFYYVFLLAMILAHLVYMGVIYHRVLCKTNAFKPIATTAGSVFLAFVAWTLFSYIIMFVYIAWGVLF